MILKVTGITIKQLAELETLANHSRYQQVVEKPHAWTSLGIKIRSLIQVMDIKGPTNGPTSEPIISLNLEVVDEYWQPNGSINKDFTADYCFGHERKQVPFLVLFIVMDVLRQFNREGFTQEMIRNLAEATEGWDEKKLEDGK